MGIEAVRASPRLHGGPAIPDYTQGLADELGGLFTTYRYTQRGTPPSSGAPPYDIEAHMDDALAVLDAHGIDRAWLVGHSWGGHLALHLLVSRPSRLLGVVCVGPLGASPSLLAEQTANLRRPLTREQVALVEEIEARRRSEDVTEEELITRFGLLWPQFFVDPARATPPPARIGVRASIEGNRSISEHFARRTLARGLPEARLPALFVHGDADPLPPRSSIDTAALVPGARVHIVEACGHFPWVERPGEVCRAVESLLAV